MAGEDFTVIALPRSTDPEREFHVSLFVSPRLTPNKAKGRLAEFDHFKRWSELLAEGGAEISLFAGSQSDRVVAKPLLDRIGPELWAKVFPGDTAVRPRPLPEPPKQSLVSYPVHMIDRDALILHSIALTQEPVDHPTPTGLGFLPMARFLRKEALTDEEEELVSSEGGLAEQLSDVEGAREYQEQLAPPADEEVPPPVAPDPDFHQRCTLLAGSGRLLRRLGLVIDLRVEQVQLLRDAPWIGGRIEIDGLELDPRLASVREPRTKCHARGESGFFASPSGEDWSDGWLRLGRPQGSFTVLDLDPEASARAVDDYWRGLSSSPEAEEQEGGADEEQGEEASAAPKALRATGFSLVREERAKAVEENLERAGKGARAREEGGQDPLALEDVTRGLRLEVWDDVERAWRSLHERRIDVEAGGERIASDERDVGYAQAGIVVQGVADNAPEQVHGEIVGWDGWSLSAPPPGKTILPDGSVGEPQPEGPAGGLVTIRARVEPRTLPRLRYGRSYAFRAAAVDLAGNSTPHELGPSPEPSPKQAAAIRSSLERREGAESTAFVRAALAHFRRARPISGPGEARGVPGTELKQPKLTGDPAVDRAIGSRLARGAVRGVSEPTRMERVKRAFGRALHRSDALFVPTATAPSPAVAGELIGGLLASSPAAAQPKEVERHLDYVTAPRPFLRWSPVLPPTLVARRPFSAGESLRTLVIRSGIELSAEGEPEAVGAEDFAARNPGNGYRVTSERHLAAPKASQREAELHGKFDDAIGAAGDAERRRALALALRESGTFLDTEIPDLERPGKTVAQPGVLVVGDPEDKGEAPSVERGEPLPRGSYVIHDVDEPTLPYLADPAASGVSLVFPEAGADHRLRFPWSVEGLRLEYRGEWPQLRPYRLVLESGEELEGRVDGNAIRIALPPGTELRMRSSSALTPEQRELLGLWRTRPPEHRDDPEIAAAAADGWLWWLTPFDEIRLIHAVPRPVEAPRVPVLRAERSAAIDREEGKETSEGTGTDLRGVIDLHGPSTGRVDLEATWSEPVDDPAKDGPEEIAGAATPWGTDVPPSADFLALGREDQDAGSVGTDVTDLQRARHEFGDTKHRRVEYRVRATTRFREHFEQSPPLSVDELSLFSPPVRVSVPSATRPSEPVVRDVLPLFLWHEQSEPRQPFALRRTRRAGLRVYLERPWYETGEGELLGLVLGPLAGDPARSAEEATVSVWAADPVWRQTGPARAGELPLRDRLEVLDPDHVGEAGRPARPPERVPLDGEPGAPEVTVLGYQPEYNRERKLWFVDVSLDQDTAVWPFVRLALARYQPDSVAGLHLSRIVTCDFAQPAPDRIATVSRPAEDEVRVVVTGATGYPREVRGFDRIEDADAEGAVAGSRTLRARLERSDPEIGTDLGWTAVDELELELRGFTEERTASWVGTLRLPRALAPRRPGSRADWRVAIEEWEHLRADPLPERGDEFRTESRLVYADHLSL